MFDPSKLDLDLDENKGKKDTNLLKKTESEKIEEHKQTPKLDAKTDVISTSDDLDFLIQSGTEDTLIETNKTEKSVTNVVNVSSEDSIKL
jgi:hypothetical protein